MTTYAFLSPEWIERARKIYEVAAQRHREDESDPVPKVTLNLVVTSVPFQEDDLLAFADSRDGAFRIELGQLENPDATLTIDYRVARSIFIAGDEGAGVRSFMSGKMRVSGNLAKLLSLQGYSSKHKSDEAADQLRALTELTN